MTDRDLLADERDRLADDRDRIADRRERIADERDRIADDREATLDALVIARGHTYSPQHTRDTINRSDARIARDRAKADREEASVNREEAASHRAELRSRRLQDDVDEFRHRLMLQAHAAVQHARMLRGAELPRAAHPGAKAPPE